MHILDPKLYLSLKIIYEPFAGDITRVEISRSSKSVTVTVHTARPGIVIGKGGEEVNRLKDEIKQLTKKKIQINISEVKRPELDAALVGSNIGHQLQKKVSYRRVVNKVIQSTMRMGAVRCSRSHNSCRNMCEMKSLDFLKVK